MATLERLAREFVRRVSPPAAPEDPSPVRLGEFLATFFPEQRQVIDSADALNALLCTRRAGKSTSIPGILFSRADAFRRCVHLYIHPDGGKRARETLWKDFCEINRAYQLGWTTNETTATLSRQDGTEIRLRGADDAREVEKIRGDTRPIATAVVDETQNFRDADLRKLVFGVLEPALADVKGQLYLCGTPGVVCAGLWWEITRNEDTESEAKRLPGWRVFSWSCLHNPHRRHNLADRIVAKITQTIAVSAAALRLLLLSPQGPTLGERYAQNDPTLIREYFGRWVNDSRALFYAFDARRNLYDGTLPRGHQWVYFLGCDLGFVDDFAYVVWAVSITHPVIYEVESFSQAGLLPSECAQLLAKAIKKWNPVRSVADEAGLGKPIAEEWRRKYGISIHPAKKTEKPAAVLLLNGELRDGRIKVLADNPLAREWGSLRKDAKSPPGKPPQEDPTQPNHAADGGLYGFREAFRWAGREDTPEAEPGSPEALAAQEAERIQSERAELERYTLGRRNGYDELDPTQGGSE